MAFFQALALAREYPGVCVASAGLHPTETNLTDDELTAVLDEIGTLLDEHPDAFRALGEIGLDFYWDKSPPERQKVAFRRQLDMAVARDLAGGEVGPRLRLIDAVLCPGQQGPALTRPAPERLRLGELERHLANLVEEALDQNTAVELLRRRGRILEQELERWSDAADCYSKLAALRSTDPEVGRRLRHCLRKSGRHQDLLMVLERENAIAGLREVMGATDPAKADEGTIRKEFASNVERNIIHGSDSPESAAFEISYYFNALEITSA